MTTRPSAPRIASLALGLAFTVFGLNGFLHFLPQPPLEGAAGAFGGALAATGYMFPLIKGTEVVAGLMLLSNRYVPLALALLAPVLVNIVLFHAFLAPAGTAMGVILLAIELYVAWSYRGTFAPMLRAQTEPTRSAKQEAVGRAASAAA